MEQSDPGKTGGRYCLFRCQARIVEGWTCQLLPGGPDKGLPGTGSAADGQVVEVERAGGAALPDHYPGRIEVEEILGGETTGDGETESE